ncbi:MAG: leucyl/phenylalanyl-tRNA--protein transferase [Azospirillum sp.]|nr:leucyl/phenylalanyl-tRNA--protein transferase [Azospirillum sp.]
MARLTHRELLWAYANGIFPMARAADDPEIGWYDPDPRGVLPLEAFHVPRSLAKKTRAGRYEIRLDTAFRRTIEACAARESTWINAEIVRLYCELHEAGYAHSVEAWDAQGLAGGLYGVRLGAAFFGESMFALRPDASKTALVHLVARLIAGGFTLLDTQMATDHMLRFGAVEIPRGEYRRRLARALRGEAKFLDADPAAVAAALDGLLARRT